MAIKFPDAVANAALKRTANVLDYNTVYTVMAWVYVDTNGTWRIFNLSDATTNNFDILYWDSGVLEIFSYTAGVGATGYGSTLSAGTWYHVCVVRADKAILGVYLNGVFDSVAVNDVTSRAAAALEEIGQFQLLGGTTRGRFEAIKQWSAALTQSQIQREMQYVRAINRTSLHLESWGIDTAAANLLDRSGNGYTWTDRDANITADHSKRPAIAFSEAKALVEVPVGQPAMRRWGGTPYVDVGPRLAGRRW